MPHSDELSKMSEDSALIPTNIQDSGASAELPRWRCHKEVWASKIIGITDPTKPGNETDGSRLLNIQGPYALLRVDAEWIRKHNPEVGGYYVVYKDGYKSYSPAQAFEEGYTRL
jgi:hypothetical protein